MLPIVIVDDSREDALLAQRVLTQCKVQNPITILGSGEECLDYFKGDGLHAARSLPCLLFLDMVMAPVSGLDVLRELSRLPEARGSVLIMLSGLTELRTIHEGYQLGAHTFLVKPLAAEDVIQMLNTIPALTVVKLPSGYEIAPSTSDRPGEGRRSDPELRIKAERR